MSSFDLTNASLSLSLDEFEKRYVEPWLKTQSMEAARAMDQWILDQYRIAEGYEKPYVRIEGKAKITKIGRAGLYPNDAGDLIFIRDNDWEFDRNEQINGGYTPQELVLIAKQWGDKSSGI